MAITGTDARSRRHRRIRGKVIGTAERPRLSVARSNKRIYAQLIDDRSGHTIAAAGSHESDMRTLAKTDAAAAVGTRVAERGREAGITQAVFDRAGYRYHGRVARLAEAAREAGLDF